MDFGSIIRRGRKADRVFDDLQVDMAHALEESMTEISAPESVDGFDLDESVDDENEPGGRAILQAAPMAPETDDIAERSAGEKQLTAHTRGRLEALQTFESLYQGSHGNLQDVGAKLLEMRTLLVSVGELANILNTEIHRANDMELANVRLLAEQRRLWEQLQDSTRKHQERENLMERLQQRETMLFQENEALRSSLAAAKLGAVEAASANARSEAAVNDLAKTLTARTADVERRSRENELLREKNVALSLELDKLGKREAESRHKLDETIRIHENEAVRNAELLGALAKSEKEALRLQKELDRALAKQAELKESVSVMEAEREGEIERGLAEGRGMRAEIQNLQTRLDNALQHDTAMTGENAELKQHLKDTLSEKHVLDERLSALIKESEVDRLNLSRANANLSELMLRQASEQIQFDVRVQECEDLRAEIAGLNAHIKELLPYERLHRVTQARQRDGQGSVVDFSTMSADTKRSGRRPNGSGRRHVT